MISQAVEASFINLTPPIADNELENWQADTNFGNIQGMYVRSGLPITVSRSIVKFDLSAIPAGSKINNAYLQLVYYSAPLGNPAGRTYNAYRLTQNWTELESTWNSRDTGVPWTIHGGVWTSEDSASSIVPFGKPAVMGWIVTDIVKDWIENGQPNYGFIIRDQNDGVAGTDAAAHFYTRDNADAWPFLTINYTPIEPTPIEPVGGYNLPVNKLTILTPYLALAGLIVVVSTVYIIKRRND